MKTISLAANIILLTILIFSACSKNDIKTPAGSCPACKDYSGIEFNKISIATAKTLADNYQKENLPKLEIGDSTDAACIWFSIESMKAFIWKIENATCNSTCKPLNLGIRIYYAKYPKDMQSVSNLGGLPPNYAQHHTVFMLATFNKNGVNTDFDPADIGNDVCNPEPLKVDTPYSQKSILGFIPGVELWNLDQEEAKNHGDLIPPGGSDGTRFY